MPNFKKPPRGRAKRNPYGSRPGGTTKPEGRPIRPKVPGTKDKPRRRRLTTDPRILRGRRPKI